MGLLSQDYSIIIQKKANVTKLLHIVTTYCTLNTYKAHKLQDKITH